MQNSQPYPGFPRKARIAPRRARRGALMPAAVLAVLVITIVMSQFAQAQLRHASAARSEARAVQLAAIAADFDYYVHENRVRLANTLTGANKNRKIDAREWADFEENFLRGGVDPRIPGFELEYQISLGAEDTEVFGALRLSTSDKRGRTQICAVIARLARHGARPAVPAAPQSTSPEPTKPRPARTCDASISEHLILTAPLSGIDPKYVLREDRAGHPPPKLVGGGVLDLGGHNLTVTNLTATGGGESTATNVVGPLSAQLMTGKLTSVSSVPVKEGTPASDAVVGGNIDVAGTTKAGKFIVGSRLTSGGLGIFADSATSTTGSDPASTTTVVVIKGLMTLSRHLQTHTLGAAKLTATRIATQHLTLTGLLKSKTMVADTFQTPVLKNIQIAADGVPKLTARQVFATARVKVDRLQTEGCTGC